MPSSNTTRARTSGVTPSPAPIPLPGLDQLAPSQRAIAFTAPPPASVNLPPTYRAGPPPSSNTASARTAGADPPLAPLPSADQLAPSHFAMRFAFSPPAVRNVPPA